MNSIVTRRSVLQGIAAAGAGLAMSSPTAKAAAAHSPFRYCLNTSTIRQCSYAGVQSERLPLAKAIEVAAKAGYQGIEPWVPEINQHAGSGGSLLDLRQQIQDAGLVVESAIGFASWIVDDDAQRKQGLESLKRDMELVAKIGGKRIAAPPVGATNQTDLDLLKAAQRYRAALELGQQTGVVPQLELWGFSKSLSRLGELIFVAVESGHPDACMLPDIYHIYKGGSDFTGLQLIDGRSIHVLHVNDYPDIPRDKIGDGDRVYPGDGVAPVPAILRRMRDTGFAGALSLELFNPNYYKQDALDVAKTGLAKIREVVARADC